mmetsp:Transcript_16158/g.34946  ORF Transcript_16158/g.34946 Transcript_16158/m.34946 type:complete len:478 (+) Transcript_16158:176-1609(+)
MPSLPSAAKRQIPPVSVGDSGNVTPEEDTRKKSQNQATARTGNFLYGMKGGASHDSRGTGHSDEAKTVQSGGKLDMSQSRSFGSGSPSVLGDKSKSGAKPALRQSVTGLSLASSQVSLRARDLPRISRVQSNFSLSSPHTDRPQTSSSVASLVSKSTILSDLRIGSLRAHNTVALNLERPIEQTYIKKWQLGEGGFGQVWLMGNKDTEKEYAVKYLSISLKSPEEVKRIEFEMQVFARMQHENIVRLHEVFRDQGYVYLVMELCMGGDLMDYLINWWGDRRYPERKDAQRQHYCKGLPWQEVGPLLFQMLTSIAYLHHHRFCHRDVKLENFMLQAVEARPAIKLVDFGMSVMLKKGSVLSDRVGTLMYMAPEVLAARYDEKCDIWSIGICTYILCLKVTPYGEEQLKDPEVLANCIFQNSTEGWPDCDKPPELRQLVNRMMVYEADQRPGAKQLFKESAWLRKYGRRRQTNICCSLH